MAACVSCGKEVGREALCSCGSVQAMPGGLTYFDALGVPVTFALEASDLDKRFRALSLKLHPDRFARRDPAQRKSALAWTTALNDAYRALKDPLRRAEYFLAQHGLRPLGEGAKAGDGQRLGLEFLEEAMEDREQLAEAKATGAAEVEALRQKVVAKVEAATRAIADGLGAFERSGDRASLEVAADKLSRLRYHQRFLEEVEGRVHE